MDRTKWTFFQRGHQSGPWAHEKMFSMPNLQGNGNKNHSEVPTIPVRMVIIKKIRNRCCLVRLWRKGNPYTVAS